ncbi:ketopantoate reductase family protein [Bacillus wiedmannii]|uniref:Ketopantoate reductase N-terminal domain-containing protein n=1 Tax=Bacillus wiedmannii TaxID=1890302 RepID=A0A2A7W736_9BACI|nr:2-dehydropantoate 2-reductase N-terminal domain-containing protein [Bacillus wiedmannii]PEJ11471.1 hypothetical protein CN684_00450 [Bacillus wiedmannii]PHC66325.1 hypothetical protein COF35_16945 [Bacillus wiedmannii]
MKILIFGAGVIGSVYGYVLTKAGFDVTHYVRPKNVEKLEQGILLNLFDGRDKKRVENTSEIYKLKIVDELPSFDQFDLVLVSVRHYQLESVLPLISKKMGKADILFFNHLWDDFEKIDSYIPREKYLWGFPSAGGGFYNTDSVILNGVIMDKVFLGEVGGQKTPRIEKITKMFNKARIQTDIQNNMLHWLWKQFALNAGISSMTVKSGSAVNFMDNIQNLQQGVLNIREALEVCKARGVNIKEFTDAKIFFLPSWLAAMGFWVEMKKNRPQRKIFELYNGTEEMKRVYYDILNTGIKLDISIPNLKSMKNYVDHIEETFIQI